VRARAEGLDLECKVGLMQRPERLVVISLGGLITEFTLIISIILVAVLANFTAFQRVYHVWVVENEEKWKTLPPDSPHE
jgi:CDP-diacylglycerol--glycerol-3-phosphate 3-phosphatidyltransferase